MDETISIKKELVEKALKDAMDAANIPQRQHLMVVEALARRMAEHKTDIERHRQYVSSNEETLNRFNQSHDNLTSRVNQVEANDSAREQRMADFENFAKEIRALEPLQGEQGEPGNDADEQRVIDAVLKVLPSLIPQPETAEAPSLDEDALVERVVYQIKSKQSLDLSHIKGAQKFIKDGVSYKIEELMHGGGSKGSGLAYLTATGTVDNSNKVFTFASAPTVVVVNGASYINGSGVTIAGTTATLDNPAGTGGSVFGLG